jgi:hypothetical protein
MFIICSPAKLKMPLLQGFITIAMKGDPKKNHIYAILLFQNVAEAQCASEIHYRTEFRILYRVLCSYLINGMKDKIKT